MQAQMPRFVDAVRERIETNLDEGSVSLADLASGAGVSPSRLLRTFRRTLGVTPRQYTDALRLDRLKARVASGASVTDALYAVGYGSSRSVYETAGAKLGMTPGEYGKGGRNQRIDFDIIPCPLGRLLVAATRKGVCAVKLDDDPGELESRLRREFPQAAVSRNPAALHPWVHPLIEYLTGGITSLELPVDIRATAFQRRVWEHLRTIPYGEHRSYQQVAQAVGAPQAWRAVARACASNPTVLIVPCHRVIRSNGDLGGYSGGPGRKRALLEMETAGTRQMPMIPDAAPAATTSAP